MNKQDLIHAVYERSTHAQNKAQTENTINTMLEVISRHLSEGDQVTLHSFGSFEVVKKKAREGRNPATGEAIHIPAKNAVKFSAFKPLKDAVQ